MVSLSTMVETENLATSTAESVLLTMEPFFDTCGAESAVKSPTVWMQTNASATNGFLLVPEVLDTGSGLYACSTVTE